MLTPSELTSSVIKVGSPKWSAPSLEGKSNSPLTGGSPDRVGEPEAQVSHGEYGLLFFFFCPFPALKSSPLPSICHLYHQWIMGS